MTWLKIDEDNADFKVEKIINGASSKSRRPLEAIGDQDFRLISRVLWACEAPLSRQDDRLKRDQTGNSAVNLHVGDILFLKWICRAT